MERVCFPKFSHFAVLPGEEQERWLADMAAQGWLLTKTKLTGCVFEPCEPEVYHYRLELLKHPLRHPETQEYLRFLQEMGMDTIPTGWRWVYLRRKASEGPLELYSDVSDQIRYHRRMLRLMDGLFLIYLMNVIGCAVMIWINVTDGRYAVAIFYPFLLLGFLALCIGLLMQRVPLARSLRRLLDEQRVRE